MSMCLLLGAASAGHATAAEQSEVKKPATIRLSDQKVHHPCARKSADSLNKKAAPFLDSIHTHAKKYGVDHDLVKSVITIESCYQQRALSPKDAQGLMQLIPATAERFGVSDVYDADQNVRAGTKYLSWLSNRFDGDLQKVLAGYNAGEGRVDQYGGIPPFRETRNYVHDVLVVYKKFKSHQSSATQTKTKADEAITAPQATPAPAPDPRQQQLARQQQMRLAEQQRVAALTPAQRQWEARQRQEKLAQQVRQREYLERQQQLAQQARHEENKRAELAAKQASQTHEVVIGQLSSPIRQQPQQKPQPQPQAPVFIQVSNKVVKNADGTPAATQDSGGRVQRTYTSPFKPGRGGREANKLLAPQLYKQQ